MKINVREIIIAILIFVVVFAIVQLSIGAYKVDMQSMTPTFLDGDCVMVDKLTYRFRGPHRGEVVILWPPVSTKNPYIKRVIGLPGETVKIEHGRVYIKTKASDEFRFLQEKPEMPLCRNNNTWVIPAGQYFVLGDNRHDSQDSSYFGPVSRGKIVGKTWLRYWPLSRFGLTPDYSYKLVSTAESASTTSIDVAPMDSIMLAATP